jgi:hypothetical protein
MTLTIIYAHDIHVGSLVADVIYAHDVHAPQVNYRRLVLIDGDEKGGGADIHAEGQSLQAQEIHAHDIPALSIIVDTLYAHAVHNDRGLIVVMTLAVRPLQIQGQEFRQNLCERHIMAVPEGCSSLTVRAARTSVRDDKPDF